MSRFRARHTIVRLALVAALLAVAAVPFGLGSATAHAEEPLAPSGRILVGFRSGTTPSDGQTAHERAGGQPVSRVSKLRIDVVAVDPGQVGAALATYREDPRVSFAEPDFLGGSAEVPNDPNFSKQWNLSKIKAPQAWNESKGSGVRIAILDTGVDLQHPDLKGKVVAKRNFTGDECSNDDSVDDANGHGTHIAGVAAAVTDNGVGVAGVGRASSLMVGKVLNDAGKGYYSWWICGITWAADNGAKVINLSLGGPSASQALKSAVDYAWNRGVVVVAAAGNGGKTTAFYPAYYANTIAVASTNSADALSGFSNRGAWVDIAAPGEGIYSTLPTSTSAHGAKNYGTLSGTSMATPHVAGLAALIWANGATSAAQVRNILQSTADRVAGTGTWFEHGRINAAKAVGADSAPPPSNTNGPTPPPPTVAPLPPPPPPNVAAPAPRPARRRR